MRMFGPFSALQGSLLLVCTVPLLSVHTAGATAQRRVGLGLQCRAAKFPPVAHAHLCVSFYFAWCFAHSRIFIHASGTACSGLEWEGGSLVFLTCTYQSCVGPQPAGLVGCGERAAMQSGSHHAYAMG